jgi:hypothetical protein
VSGRIPAAAKPQRRTTERGYASVQIGIVRRLLEEETMAGQFLVLWKLELSRATPDVVRAVLRQQDYGARLLAEGKLEGRYHLVGGHGGA